MELILIIEHTFLPLADQSIEPLQQAKQPCGTNGSP
jgi:hypothetical protein